MNPYGPGAGTLPPELSGRDEILTEIDQALHRKLAGRPHRGAIFVGLRGVGKTVLLLRAREIAHTLGYRIVDMEVRENGNLAALIVPALRTILYELDICLSVDPEIGTADSGDSDTDLSDLLTVVAEAAKSRKSGILLLIDELQYLHEDELSALIVALHRTTQRNLPILFFAAGLPTIRGKAGRAKSYAERLFIYPEIGPLKETDAYRAIEAPAEREGMTFTQNALKAVFAATNGYPYFIQKWAYQAWNVARKSPVTVEDIHSGRTPIFADNGGTRSRPATLKRNCRTLRRRFEIDCSYPGEFDCKRHDLQPLARRRGIHRSAFRRVHAKSDASVTGNPR